jgi:dihydrofolate reductase
MSSIKKILIAAITLDGKIAKSADHDVDWTSKEDKAFFRDETKKAGVVIFGSSTYKAIGRPMPDRLNIIMTRHPEDYADKEKEGLLEFTTDDPQTILEKLAKRGFNKVVIGGGSAIYSLFLEKKLIDEIYLTIAPKIFGKGVDLFKEMDIENVGLELLEVGKLGNGGEVLMKYKLNANLQM